MKGIVKDNLKEATVIDKKIYRNKKKRIIFASIIAVIIIIGILFSTIFALINITSDKIIEGVMISGIDVSGLSKEEAKTKVEEVYINKKEKDIKIKYEEYEANINPTLLEVEYKIDESVEETYQIGKKGNIFKNNYDILFSLIKKKNINVDMSFNEEITKQLLEDIGANLPGIVVDSSYFVEDTKLIISKGRDGIYIDTENLLSTIKNKFSDINSNDEYIEIPITNKIAKEIDIDKIYEEIHVEAKDAYYTKDPFTVYPEIQGIDFDIEEAKEILKEEKEEYIINVNITNAKVTISDIGLEVFPDKLSTFTTRYDAGDINRTTNLVIASNKIDGKIVLPGETFSFNNALGARTLAAGYKNAKVYENGEVVDGIGGGICQISSTLYNAILMADLEPVERRNHQFTTSYVPAGRDATVVYGIIDFKFKNTREYPIKIEATSKNGISTVNIYGIKQDKEYIITFNTKTIATIPFSTKYEETFSIPAGTEKIRQNGGNGVKTETYITKSLNGKIISTDLLSKDTYNAMTKIILKGKG